MEKVCDIMRTYISRNCMWTKIMTVRLIINLNVSKGILFGNTGPCLWCLINGVVLYASSFSCDSLQHRTKFTTPTFCIYLKSKRLYKLINHIIKRMESQTISFKINEKKYWKSLNNLIVDESIKSQMKHQYKTNSVRLEKVWNIKKTFFAWWFNSKCRDTLIIKSNTLNQ